MKDPKAEDTAKKNERSGMGKGQVRTISEKGTQENKGLSDVATCSLIILYVLPVAALKLQVRAEQLGCPAMLKIFTPCPLQTKLAKPLWRPSSAFFS